MNRNPWEANVLAINSTVVNKNIKTKQKNFPPWRKYTDKNGTSEICFIYFVKEWKCVLQMCETY